MHVHCKIIFNSNFAYIETGVREGLGINEVRTQ